MTFDATRTLMLPFGVACALALSACATGASNGYAGGGASPCAAACQDCGTVTRIEQGNGSRTPQATGAVVGAVVGDLAAREVAKDETDSEGRQDTATVAGTAADAAIGHAIQNRAGMDDDIVVRMADSRERVVSQNDLDGIRVGTQMEIRDNRAFVL